MSMNPQLERLHPYPFERLNQLKAGIVPPSHLAPISLSIGEPKHPSPAFVKQVLVDHIDALAVYPTTKGGQPLRDAIATWLQKRFNLASWGIMGAIGPHGLHRVPWAP